MVDRIVEIVCTWVNTLKLNIAEHYLAHICSVLITLTTRVQLGHHVTLNDNLLDYDKLKKMADVLLSKQFLESIAYEYHLEFSEADVTFFANYLKADRIQIVDFENIDQADMLIYRQILAKLERIIDTSLDEHNELVRNFLLHLNAMVFRLRNKITVRNNLIDNIKREFGILFNLIWLVLESESEALRIRITEDEVGFLLIHIQNIIEQQKKSKNILLVCPHGIVTANLILNRIRDILPSYNFIETISFERINAVNLDSIDFVISTVDIPNLKKPLVKVSPIITKEDLINITTFYQGLMFNQPAETHEFPTLCRFIDERFIYESMIEDKEALIQSVCEDLAAAGYVDAAYAQSVIHRESLGATDNRYLFAVPHGDIRHVRQTMISIVLLKNPIRWGKHLVQVVVFFSVSERDLSASKAILKDVYNLIHSKVFNQKIRDGLNKEQFIQFISKEG